MAQEIKIKLNTGEGQVNFKTGKIKGFIDSVILNTGEDAETKVEIVIHSELGYLILQRKGISGVKYYAPRVRTTTPIEDLKDFPSHAMFYVHENLEITVIGQKNKEINIILRIV